MMDKLDYWINVYRYADANRIPAVDGAFASRDAAIGDVALEIFLRERGDSAFVRRFYDHSIHVSINGSRMDCALVNLGHESQAEHERQEREAELVRQAALDRRHESLARI